MKTVSVALQAHLDGDTSLAELIKITRADGEVLAFTTFDRDLVVGGVTYVADGSFSFGAVENDAALKTKNLKAAGLLDSALISEADLRAGFYDHARIDVYVCNWADLTAGVLQIRRGWLGEVSLIGGQFVAELRGLQDLLQRKVGNVYTPECRHELGDAVCAACLTPVTGTVTSVTDRSSFGDNNCSATDGLFDYGKLTWMSGANKGLAMEVKSWDLDNQLFALWLPMPNAIAVGDAYQVVAGCDKTQATCKAKFSNIKNFGGFPHLPGLAKILQYPESS